MTQALGLMCDRGALFTPQMAITYGFRLSGLFYKMQETGS